MASSQLLTAPTASSDLQTEVLVLGAGMSGLCMGIELKQAGIDDFIIVEKQAGIGGTWWDNIYPGAHVDLPAPLYCFSFAPNSKWRQRFAAASEIQSYMERCSSHYGLLPHLRLNTKVETASFDEDTGTWVIQLSGPNGLQRVRTRFFICSTGPLSQVRWPSISGFETFSGRRLHSARWDQTYSAKGQRIAVIGTGSTGCQLIPKLAEEAKHLYVFQRTPNWIMPRLDRPYTFLDRVLANFPPYANSVRGFWYYFMELSRHGFTHGTVMRSIMMSTASYHLKRQVTDPLLREKLTPPYPMGCKRIIFSSDYYPAICKRNVSLVTIPIDHLTPSSIVTADGAERLVDTVVCATGFETTRLLSQLEIKGLSGRSLRDVWSDTPEAYLGVAVADFPNMFFLLGPNTATGHTSTLLYIEPQARHILNCIKVVRQGGYRWICVRREAQSAYNQALQQRLTNSVWSTCTSWYRNKSGRIVMLWPGTTPEYVKLLQENNSSGYFFMAS